ncbi:3'-5' exonuclease [Neolewinella lacunae]|uniref:3'-5' exonuclease n=1 Tax=Neolewinella lacunae TaxID=1517758 RepID=A0A923T9K2_9BACT|nr:3'-5' exonuclease [Neolewinella lacunae]MBC6995158.1 3'-5' exonuclease [Neolewinella lacunae]MDN3634108.1 3'-5' exonuclease [Neolewinella lacunae]
MPTYLIFDTETTGLPKSWKAPMKDIGNWPSIVQLAWQLVDGEMNTLAAECFIIQTKVPISAAAAKMHGITQQRSLREGKPLLEVLDQFTAAIVQADVLVAHNLDFDHKVLGSEYLRAGRKPPFGKKKMICTMKSSVDFCRLPGPYGYKWPTLEELHKKLLGEGFSGAHHAGTDVEMTRRCLGGLVGAGVVG